MKKNKKFSIIDKSDTMPCWRCNATGKENGKKCPLCKGSREWIEKHYVIIDHKNNIAVDTDTGA
jgi:RNA polymerase subunit RPABC4/transcription elongation factor Spt4